jgi:hypothetical protein
MMSSDLEVDLAAAVFDETLLEGMVLMKKLMGKAWCGVEGMKGIL